MKVERSITTLPRPSPSMASMAPVLRILTIIAFAAHSLLGCCLSHGDCRLERESASVEQCCDHDHSHHDENSDTPDHGESHDHAECVLGDLGVETKGTDWQFAFLGFCDYSVAKELLAPSLLRSDWFCRLGSVPRHDSSRAALQVWHI